MARPQLPRGLAAVLGAVLLALGVAITFRPFASWTVLVLLVSAAMVATGIGDLAEARHPGARVNAFAGGAWLLGGLAVLTWPGTTVQAVTLVVGAAMALGGAARIWAGVRGRRDDRVTAVLSGTASVVFGVLALTWPDITVLVIAVVFGARTVLFGLDLLVGAFRRRDASTAVAHADTGQPETRRPARRPVARIARAAGATASLVVALALLAASVSAHRAVPRPDAFYDPPATIPGQPGALLRSEPFVQGMPPDTEAWRTLFTSTLGDGMPALASAVVVAPEDHDVTAEAVPVLAWAHGTTGVARSCAPSLLDDPLGAGALLVPADAIAEGWAIVATDYTGLGTAGHHAYLIGEPAARNVLDAVRAARQIDGLALADQTVVWGHSQGGGSALWTGQVQPGYAPDVPLAGVAALAPASDLAAFADNLDEMRGGSIFESFVITGYASFYPDVVLADYVRPGALTMVERAATRCLSEPATFASVAASLGMRGSILAREPTTGPLGQRFAENTPRGEVPAPLLVAQGEDDEIIPVTAQRAYVAARCDEGQRIDYREYPGLGHMGLVMADSPLVDELLVWTRDRFAGRKADSSC